MNLTRETLAESYFKTTESLIKKKILGKQTQQRKDLHTQIKEANEIRRLLSNNNKQIDEAWIDQ